MALHQTLPSNSFEQWRQNTNAADIAVGDLATLTTANKSSIIAAINEIDAVDGNLASLNTTDKSSIVAAVNEVKATAADDAFLNALLFGG